MILALTSRFIDTEPSTTLLAASCPRSETEVGSKLSDPSKAEERPRWKQLLKRPNECKALVLSALSILLMHRGYCPHRLTACQQAFEKLFFGSLVQRTDKVDFDSMWRKKSRWVLRRCTNVYVPRVIARRWLAARVAGKSIYLLATTRKLINKTMAIPASTINAWKYSIGHLGLGARSP